MLGCRPRCGVDCMGDNTSPKLCAAHRKILNKAVPPNCGCSYPKTPKPVSDRTFRGFVENSTSPCALPPRMARFPRTVIPECPHHVTQRGNGRRPVFHSLRDRQVYLGLLKKYSQLHELRILGYCLMTNHVHLVVDPKHEDSLPKTFRELHGGYARYKNATEQSSGHLWQNRYYSCPFEASRLASVLRYVEMNPVRAGLVAAAEDYTWSSALIHLGGPDIAGFVDLHLWSQQWSAEEWGMLLQKAQQDEASIRQATHTGRPLGSSVFVTDLEQRLGRRLEPGRGGRPKKDRAIVAAA